MKKKKDILFIYIFGINFSTSSLFPASHIALIAKRPAAGAAKIAMHVVILVKNGTNPSKLPKVQVLIHRFVVTPMMTNAKVPIKNDGTRSLVIVPNAKNERIPMINPNIAKIAATGVVSHVTFSKPPDIPMITPRTKATRIPIKNSQLPTFLNISIFHPYSYIFIL